MSDSPKPIQINGNDVARYVFVLPRYNVSHLVVRRVEALCDKINKAVGSKLTYHRDYFFDESPFEIVVAHCDRDGVQEVEDRDAYTVRVVGSKVFVNVSHNCCPHILCCA